MMNIFLGFEQANRYVISKYVIVNCDLTSVELPNYSERVGRHSRIYRRRDYGLPDGVLAPDVSDA